jgi:type VII secretion-associated serine protease mycosin
MRATASVIALALVTGAAGTAPIEWSARAGHAEPALAAGLPAVPTATDMIRGREWWLFALHAPGAWRWSKGRGVTVAVLDTGVDSRHPDLTGQVITGEDFTGGYRRPGSKYWGRHGSAMASIIAGHGHGPGMSAGVVGIAPQAKVLSIRVTWENDDPVRDSTAEVNRNRDAVAKGIRYAVDHGANIINMSLGGGKLFYNGSPVEEAAIRYALSKGVVLIASAGNDGAGLNRKNFPAAYPGVIAVGAVDRDLRPWADSNRHAYVKVAAPGVDIVSADAGGGYVLGTGTSPSAAIVAGIAALIRSRYPKLTSVQVAEALAEGATPAGSGARSTALGAGVTDAVKAVNAAQRINAAGRTRQAAAPPPVSPQTASESREGGPNLLFVGAIAVGGVLVVVGLVLGWAQRRRRPEEEDEDYDEVPVWHGEEHAAPVRRSAPVRSAAPVGVPPWQSTEAFVPPPAPDEDTGTPVWPPSPPRTAASNGGRNGNGNGQSPGRPVLLDPFDVAAASPWSPGNGSKWRHGTEPPPDDLPLDFGDDPLEPVETGPLPELRTPSADESWRPVQPHQGKVETVGFPSVPPDEQPTGAFSMVSRSPDEQPTGAFTAVPSLPDEQPTGAFSMVSRSPDEQPASAFTAVPRPPDHRPAGRSPFAPGSPPGPPAPLGPPGHTVPSPSSPRAAPPVPGPGRSVGPPPAPAPLRPPGPPAPAVPPASPMPFASPPAGAPSAQRSPGSPPPDAQPTTAFRAVPPGEVPPGAPRDEVREVPPGVLRDDARDVPGPRPPVVPRLHPAEDEGHRLPWS